MIIQTGMRTDIPAFYSEWLCNRIKEADVMVRNPISAAAGNKIYLFAFCGRSDCVLLEKSGAYAFTHGFTENIWNVLVRYHYPLWKRNRASGSRCRSGNRYISATG